MFVNRQLFSTITNMVYILPIWSRDEAFKKKLCVQKVGFFFLIPVAIFFQLVFNTPSTWLRGLELCLKTTGQLRNIFLQHWVRMTSTVSIMNFLKQYWVKSEKSCLSNENILQRGNPFDTKEPNTIINIKKQDFFLNCTSLSKAPRNQFMN